jgi:carboxymethylenebutenolidase
MSRTQLEIDAADGPCIASLFHPSGDGPWPSVLFFMDALGIRPALLDMAERLASHGYFVLLPDLFYRAGPYESPDPKTIFSDPEKRAAFAKYPATATHDNIRRDTERFLHFLASQPDVKQPAVGAVGYCMGGGLALAAAGNFPGRVVAAASYHGGRLATDAPDSPHLLAPKMKARVYVGGAIEDTSFTDEMKQRLETALTEANVKHTIETYPAKHGWAVPDMPVYDQVQAERHWDSLLALFKATLQ